MNDKNVNSAVLVYLTSVVVQMGSIADLVSVFGKTDSKGRRGGGMICFPDSGRRNDK